MVRRILQAVPPRFDQIAHSIETLLDVDNMTVEELVGRLKSAEVRDRSRNLPAATNSNGKLLLSEEWLVRYKQQRQVIWRSTRRRQRWRAHWRILRRSGQGCQQDGQVQVLRQEGPLGP